jgi:hypothetical protein
MNQRGADQPGHERGVLDRIPEPPAAPAEFVIGPPAARARCRWSGTSTRKSSTAGSISPRPDRAALEHRGAGEGERHREADIAGVEHRRMNREREILQHRIQIGAVRRRRHQPRERIRGPQREQHEAALIRPITPSTRLEKLCGSWRLKAATATLQIDRIRSTAAASPRARPTAPPRGRTAAAGNWNCAPRTAPRSRC